MWEAAMGAVKLRNPPDIPLVVPANTQVQGWRGDYNPRYEGWNNYDPKRSLGALGTGGIALAKGYLEFGAPVIFVSNLFWVLEPELHKLMDGRLFPDIRPVELWWRNDDGQLTHRLRASDLITDPTLEPSTNAPNCPVPYRTNGRERLKSKV